MLELLDHVVLHRAGAAILDVANMAARLETALPDSPVKMSFWGPSVHPQPDW